MKKILILAAVVASLAMTSCGKSAKDYVKDMVDLQMKYEALVSEGKMEEAEKVRKEAQEIAVEVAKRAMEDPEFAKELKAAGEQLESVAE